jgi:alkanesulfonate monooxygenase SsuD/methylene tetrahydromethanopterin reductase-like flavin-dependent oxidoreductase (luciferase family)
VDLVNRYDPAELPRSLTAYVREREGYDYRHHAEVGSSNATFVSDEIADRFSLIGDVDDHVAKLLRLVDAGVDQFNLYLMNGEEEEQLDIYGREVIPAFREALAAR